MNGLHAYADANIEQFSDMNLAVEAAAGSLYTLVFIQAAYDAAGSSPYCPVMLVYMTRHNLFLQLD